jgi:predicted Zn-dependent protease with MMP-like domain
MATLDDRILEIERALDAEEWEEALELSQEGLEEHPQSAWLHGFVGESLAALGELDAACEAYERAARIEPGAPEFAEALSDAYLRSARFDDARATAQRALAADPQSASALDILAYIAERAGDIRAADDLLARARAADPESRGPCRLDEAEFRSVVKEALETLPEDFQRALEKNLAIIVEPVPSAAILGSMDSPLDPTILGVYSGVPLPDREPSHTPPPLPDTIHLFQRNLEHICGNRDELIEEIATTLYHEVAHYFGFEEDEMEGLGLE